MGQADAEYHEKMTRLAQKRGVSDNPDLGQAERPRGSCLVCGYDRPFRVWVSGGEVGACDECYEAKARLAQAEQVIKRCARAPMTTNEAQLVARNYLDQNEPTT